MSIGDCRQPAVWHQQVLVPETRRGEPTPPWSRLAPQRRQPLAALQVQERPAAPLPQRPPAARGGAASRRRCPGPPLAEPLGGIVQLRRGRAARALSRRLLGDGDGVRLPRGWETSNLRLLLICHTRTRMSNRHVDSCNECPINPSGHYSASQNTLKNKLDSTASSCPTVHLTCKELKTTAAKVTHSRWFRPSDIISQKAITRRVVIPNPNPNPRLVLWSTTEKKNRQFHYFCMLYKACSAVISQTIKCIVTCGGSTVDHGSYIKARFFNIMWAFVSFISLRVWRVADSYTQIWNWNRATLGTFT